MQDKYNIWGTFKSVELEKKYLEETFETNRNYTFLTYFFCCLFFVFAGVFGDFQRKFYILGAYELLAVRLFILAISISFFLIYRKVTERPKHWELWLDVLKILSSISIFLLTWWTKGASLTLLPGIMMMVGSFYMILPGRVHSTNICAVFLLITFALLQDPVLTYGEKVHRYMIFMLFAIEVLLLFFKCKIDKWARVEFYTKKELDTINDTKDKILAAIAHDIRNPLTIIMTKAERCRIQAQKGDMSAVVDYQNSIVSSVSRLDGLLADIVDWAVTELQNGRTLKENKCIDKTIREAIEFVYEQAETKNIKFDIDVEPANILHETKMMKTCIRNVLSNAIKFSNSSSQIKISGILDANHYKIIVSDSGVGMEEDIVKDILGGVNSHTDFGSEGEKGTGLGLKLVKNVITRHEGEMEITSTPGQGTTFTFLIPSKVQSAIA
ncbi:sensor histidine kinase KdpD [Halobacteriovorax sp. HLS]|uniref:sensor histidine kinase n=1 Tax=Halobacteriovorax sp. HLS TaxID=2234000 RepID=UPI0013E3E237|nr:HAMP domain-containing sensor histidine kinase [Halobacteriovorax sp. HLS]